MLQLLVYTTKLYVFPAGEQYPLYDLNDKTDKCSLFSTAFSKYRSQPCDETRQFGAIQSTVSLLRGQHRRVPVAGLPADVSGGRVRLSRRGRAESPAFPWVLVQHAARAAGGLPVRPAQTCLPLGRAARGLAHLPPAQPRRRHRPVPGSGQGRLSSRPY